MNEPIRLIIWDLDDTFWAGTVSEGGITGYSDFNHSLVIELAHRGIISSICSKNDPAVILPNLARRGILDYFIFPSIDWSSKAHRVSEIISKTNLRPASVLFLDDNPRNLAEVKAYIPLINVMDEKFIQNIPDHPIFKGKMDDQLSRLNHYKTLERRAADFGCAGGDNIDFLRSSDIRVSIIHDVENHLSRAVELINRTNQLNFTKLRLSEDPKQAETELLKMLTDIPYARTSGLIQVSDKYGDYGFSGFYLCEQFHTSYKLIHFCFSCRTLGMGVETWMYERLGKPDLTVCGEVTLDVLNAKSVDWITLDPNPNESVAASNAKLAPKIFLRGGCDLDTVAHYLRYHCNTLVPETNYIRDGQFIRKDSLVNARAGLNQFSMEEVKDIEELGLKTEDFKCEFIENSSAGDVVILSFWAEQMLHSYKNKSHDLHILMQLRSVSLNYAATQFDDIAKLTTDLGLSSIQACQFQNRCDIMRRQYTSDFFDAPKLKEYFAYLLDQIPAGVRVIILLPSGKIRNSKGLVISSQPHIEARSYMQTLADERPLVSAVDIMESIHEESDYVDVTHFTRMVYHRIYMQILDCISLNLECSN